MKKNSFIGGAMISTIGIVLCKILGIIYVIPFRAIIGTVGGNLYNYAYNVYAVFASLSSTGIPGAMAKSISEYNTLGYYNTQERAYKICKRLLILIGFICFILLFVFAPTIVHFIKGDIEGGISSNDIVFVIRVISTALLIIPILSAGKGYIQGHRMMTIPSIANVIEQLVRVIVIILGSFLTLKVFNLSITTSVGVATFGATMGALVAYLYIALKIKKNKSQLVLSKEIKEEEKKITDKMILKKIVIYALPFILIEFIRSIYNTVDTFTLVKTLVSLGYDVESAESILSVITTWGAKLNQIVLAVTFGLTMSIIPNIVASATLKNNKDVSKKINDSIKIILFISLPMVLGIYFLADSVWTVFYGYDLLSIKVFKFLIFQTIINSFFYILVDTTNALSNPKVALLTLFGSFILKMVLNIPMMYLFNLFGLAYYGTIFTTMLTQAIAAIYLFYKLSKNYGVQYKESLKLGFKVIFINLIMLLSLLIARFFIGEFSHTRLSSIICIMIYGLIGLIIYLILAIKLNIISDIFGSKVNRILVKLHLKKEVDL